MRERTAREKIEYGVMKRYEQEVHGVFLLKKFALWFAKMRLCRRYSSEGDTAASIGSVATLPQSTCLCVACWDYPKPLFGAERAVNKWQTERGISCCAFL